MQKKFQSDSRKPGVTDSSLSYETTKLDEQILSIRPVGLVALWFLVVPVDCTWDNWSPWGPCTVTCGGGSQTSIRDIERHARNDGAPCLGESTKDQSCNNQTCFPLGTHNEIPSISKIGKLQLMQCIFSKLLLGTLGHLAIMLSYMWGRSANFHARC